MTKWEQMSENIVQRLEWDESIKRFWWYVIPTVTLEIALLWALAH